MAPIPLPSSVPLSEECLSLPPRPLFLGQHVSSSLAQVAQSGSGLRSLLHPARLAAEGSALCDHLHCLQCRQLQSSMAVTKKGIFSLKPMLFMKMVDEMYTHFNLADSASSALARPSFSYLLLEVLYKELALLCLVVAHLGDLAQLGSKGLLQLGEHEVVVLQLIDAVQQLGALDDHLLPGVVVVRKGDAGHLSHANHVKPVLLQSCFLVCNMIHGGPGLLDLQTLGVHLLFNLATHLVGLVYLF